MVAFFVSMGIAVFCNPFLKNLFAFTYVFYIVSGFSFLFFFFCGGLSDIYRILFFFFCKLGDIVAIILFCFKLEKIKFWKVPSSM